MVGLGLLDATETELYKRCFEPLGVNRRQFRVLLREWSAPGAPKHKWGWLPVAGGAPGSAAAPFFARRGRALRRGRAHELKVALVDETDGHTLRATPVLAVRLAAGGPTGKP